MSSNEAAPREAFIEGVDEKVDDAIRELYEARYPDNVGLANNIDAGVKTGNTLKTVGTLGLTYSLADIVFSSETIHDMSHLDLQTRREYLVDEAQADLMQVREIIHDNPGEVSVCAGSCETQEYYDTTTTNGIYNYTIDEINSGRVIRSEDLQEELIDRIEEPALGTSLSAYEEQLTTHINEAVAATAAQLEEYPSPETSPYTGELFLGSAVLAVAGFVIKKTLQNTYRTRIKRLREARTAFAEITQEELNDERTKAAYRGVPHEIRNTRTGHDGYGRFTLYERFSQFGESFREQARQELLQEIHQQELASKALEEQTSN